MSVGIDVVDVGRLKEALSRTPELEERLFTPAERDYCETKVDPSVHLAGTLAAKEAVMKALHLVPLIVWASRIEVLRDPSGAPHARVSGSSANIELSISHDGPVAAAIAIAGHTRAPDRATELGPWLDKIGEAI
ncbi:MAG: holo-ACP synthase [Actinobacteria bacterium]|nr:holo-ACP synthase [Actinomycetota bacterium]